LTDVTEVEDKMAQKQFDLLFTLLKLKSYLISLIDEQEEGGSSFQYTEEYLNRRVPERRDEIIYLLKENGINSDADIALDEQVHLKFKEIAMRTIPVVDLPKFLEDLQIESAELKKSDTYAAEREEKLKEILSILFKIAKSWSIRKELETDVDNYSTLAEEDVIRPDERKIVSGLGNVTSISFEQISKQTIYYLEQMIDYYFYYGGDLNLEKFLESLNHIKDLVSNKYIELFRNSGMDEEWINKYLKFKPKA
jgi:hypothetical protein